MKREDKVIRLELAKQIDVEHKRLGIKPPESEYNWDIDNSALCYGRKQTEYGHDCYRYISAYDQKELFNMIGLDIPLDKVAELVYNGLKGETKWNGKISKDTKATIKSVMLDKLDEWTEQ